MEERGQNGAPKNEDSKLAMAVKVFHNTYLGDNRAAQSEAFFSKAHVGAVLNMTPNCAHAFCSDEKIEYLRIPVHDSHGKRDVGKMYQYFPLITEFIYKVTVMEGRNLLVHCALGRQRSCTAIAAYLIRFYNMTPMEAMNFILEKKPDAFHWGASVNFAKALNRWYYKLNPNNQPVATIAADGAAMKTLRVPLKTTMFR